MDPDKPDIQDKSWLLQGLQAPPRKRSLPMLLALHPNQGSGTVLLGLHAWQLRELPQSASAGSRRGLRFALEVVLGRRGSVLLAEIVPLAVESSETQRSLQL